MNGYDIMADSYKSAVEQGQLSEEEAASKIRIYEFLGTCKDDDFFALFDSSAFNEISKSYLRLACKELIEEGILEEEQGRAIRNRFNLLFSEIQAKEVSEKVS